MAVQTDPLVGHVEGKASVLDAWAAGMTLAKLHLCAAPFIPSASSTLAELVAGEAKSPGYAAKVIGPLLGPFTGQGGVRYWLSNVSTITATAGSPEEEITGGWVDDGAGTLSAVFVLAPHVFLGGTPNTTIAASTEWTDAVTGVIELGP